MKAFSLCVNEEKTERFSISSKGDDSWKKVVLLGSLLDTESDVTRRKTLASAAWNKYACILTNKDLPLLLRIKYFEAFVTSIFLYQCGTWTLTTKTNTSIDTFQRSFLRRIVGIYYPKTIRNTELYAITCQRPWSETCKQRRLTLFGHTCRLPSNSPSRKALEEALKPAKRLVGGQKLTLLKTLVKDLHDTGISILEAKELAQNKKLYKQLVQCAMYRTTYPPEDQNSG